MPNVGGINCYIQQDPSKDYCHTCKRWVEAIATQPNHLPDRCPLCTKTMFEAYGVYAQSKKHSRQNADPDTWLAKKS